MLTVSYGVCIQVQWLVTTCLAGCISGSGLNEHLVTFQYSTDIHTPVDLHFELNTRAFEFKYFYFSISNLDRQSFKI